MIQICRKDKKKVYEAIRKGIIDSAEMSFPNLIDDIILTLKNGDLQIFLYRLCRTNAEITATFLMISFCAHIPGQFSYYFFAIYPKKEYTVME